ncbi:hypothetical protein X922_16570 [Pseudomonas aeruginosa VRFPA08]|nr:hypothetical protein X922_16570 [Pseudomonas aeruginosa VRFPA08]
MLLMGQTFLMSYCRLMKKVESYFSAVQVFPIPQGCLALKGWWNRYIS